MSLHRVRLRKDGPTHAIEFEAGAYSARTLCGLPLSGLERPVRRYFEPLDSHSCGRCRTSARKRAA